MITMEPGEIYNLNSKYIQLLYRLPCMQLTQLTLTHRSNLCFNLSSHSLLKCRKKEENYRIYLLPPGVSIVRNDDLIEVNLDNERHLLKFNVNNPYIHDSYVQLSRLPVKKILFDRQDFLFVYPNINSSIVYNLINSKAVKDKTREIL